MTAGLDLLALAEVGSGVVVRERLSSRHIGYLELREAAVRCRSALRWSAKALVAIDEPRSLSGLLGYLAALAAGHAVVLAEDASSSWWDGLIAAYRPELVVARRGGMPGELAARRGYRLRTADPVSVMCRPAGSASAPPHPNLGLLARTSGSLGPPKMVRLSFANLRANAQAIAAAVGLRSNDRVLTSIRLDSAFGLSMVNSALVTGAVVALSPLSASSGRFWDCLDQMGGTCVGAVPATYALLRRQGWDPAAHPSLRMLLHAGGPLDERTRSHYAMRMATRGGEFISMYGQTEATARISCLRGSLAATHPGSAGTALAGSRIFIEKPDGGLAGDDEAGEIVIEGPGVMMGYAASRRDLASGDLQGGVLHTGDIGFLHDEFLYVTGRADRQVKMLGRRIHLDLVENELLARGLNSAVEVIGGERLIIAVEGAAQDRSAERRDAAERFGLPLATVRVIHVDTLPRTGNGKLDRGAIRAMMTDVLAPVRDRTCPGSVSAHSWQADIEATSPRRGSVSAGNCLPTAQALVERWVGAGECLGAQLFAWRDGQVVADLAVGRSGVSRDASPADVGRLYCAVKPLTACCLARAVEAGEASFDDPASRFLPAFSAGPRKIITLRQLLTHTSGLPSLEISDPYDHEFHDLVRMACGQRTAPSRWYRKAQYDPMQAWTILGAVVERIYDLGFANVVRQVIAGPAGLPTLSMTWPDPGSYAPCHFLRKGSFTPVPEPPEAVLFSKVNPAQGGFGSARDLGLLYGELIRCVVGEGRILGHDPTRELVRQHSVIDIAPGFGERTYGLGFFTAVGTDAIGGNWSGDSFGHSGHIGRYRVCYAFGDTTHRTAVAIRLFSVGAKNNWRFHRLGLAIWSDLGLGKRVGIVRQAPLDHEERIPR